MKKSILKRCLLIAPVVVLAVTLFFLNYAVQYFRDTAYAFVYDTNVSSVHRFVRELRGLTSVGYNSTDYGDLFTHMIRFYNMTLGEKESIATFLMSEDGYIHHSTDENKEYLADILQNPDNMALLNDAFAKRNGGELELAHGEETIAMHYQWFYSGEDDYCLFMCVERENIEGRLHAQGVVIPICIVGLLLLAMTETIIWLRMTYDPGTAGGTDGEASADGTDSAGTGGSS
ncbi:MAG: hypothetical protein LBR72_07630 [Oscillospiraceae bacterium]|jgi:hypothetical protein|nr:hypothetical protein [Oscillospiraceae bacterium]